MADVIITSLCVDDVIITSLCVDDVIITSLCVCVDDVIITSLCVCRSLRAEKSHMEEQKLARLNDLEKSSLTVIPAANWLFHLHVCQSS